MEKQTLYPDISFMSELATQAGQIMQQNFRLGMARTEKEDTTPLTESDTAINRLVLDAVREHYPLVSFLGEEGDHKVGATDYEVYLDPVDGTIPFSRGLPLATFCMAVKFSHTPVAAVIYDPFTDRKWVATRGGGTFLNGQRVFVSKHAVVAGAHIGTCWWNSKAHGMHAFMAPIMDTRAKWLNLCSIAIFGGLIASGEFDASIFMSPSGLETLAMSLIVEEAGGRATDLDGNPLRYEDGGKIANGHLITNGHIHDELLHIISKVR